MIDLADQRSMDALRARFGGFFDAVLVEVVLKLPRNEGNRQATVRLLAQEQDGPWRSVAFTIGRLREFKLSEGRVSNLVLSDGLGLHRLDDGVFVDLAPFTDQPVPVGDLRRSYAYVFGETCSAEVIEAHE
jgi:hypothetical protein